MANATRHTWRRVRSAVACCFPPARLRFNRRELSGAFGDLGTDLPLLVGMILAAGMDAGWVFLLFGSLQIAAGLIYGIPMPVQPLKAVAALVIAQQLGGPLIAGGALAIAVIMAVLTLTKAVDGLARLIPRAVIRGIQFGLGAKLGLLALGKYVQSDGAAGYVLAAVAFVVVLALMGGRRFPPAVVVLLIGLAYAAAFDVDWGSVHLAPALTLPAPGLPARHDIWLGLVLLALPQVPLSLGNSMLATKQLADDWFPERRVTLRRIGATYSLFNLLMAFLGGVPVCHGAGGMAGHYAFGGRTGGSVVIYGAFHIGLGVACAVGFSQVVTLFPLPVLGVILLFEALTLVGRLKDVRADAGDLAIALVVGLVAVGLPYGFLVGMLVGTVLAAGRRLGKLRRTTLEPVNS